MRPLAFLALLLAPLGVDNQAQATNNVVFACNEFPPFKMEDSETGLPGFDVEFLEQSFLRSGITVEIVYMPWSRALKEAENGHVNGVCSCSRTDNRDHYMLFSEPLGTASSGLVSLAENGSNPPSTLGDVRDSSVGVIRGYNLIDVLEAAGVSNVIQVSSEAQAARMLLRRRLDYYYGYKGPTMVHLEQFGGSAMFRYDQLSETEYFSCFSKNVAGAEALLRTFNDGLREIKADGTYDEILAKYR